jgi:hypothetical protein
MKVWINERNDYSLRHKMLIPTVDVAFHQKLAGTATLRPGDTYSRELGVAIAMLRMKADSHIWLFARIQGTVYDMPDYAVEVLLNQRVVYERIMFRYKVRKALGLVKKGLEGVILEGQARTLLEQWKIAGGINHVRGY